MGHSNRTTSRNSSPNSPNYMDWNTQTESNPKSCCNFSYYILKSKVCKFTIANWVVPLYRLISPSNEALTQVYLHGHWCLCLHTYFSLSILGRPISKIMGRDTQIGSQKYEKHKIWHLVMALPSLPSWVINQELSNRVIKQLI